MAPAKQPRITAINLVRVFVISLVIATHIAASNDLYNSYFSGAVWIISHASRFLFIILTALVLIYNYGPGRPFDIKKFYLKRFTLILLPYATWTLIYQVWEGIRQHSLSDFLQVYIHNFITADAMYHLYFLLITMQLYLLFPLVRYVYGKVQNHPWRVLSISLALQLVMTAFMQYMPSIPGLEWWLKSPANYILSYQFFIICGLLIGTHVEQFGAFLLKYFRRIVLSSVVVTLVGWSFYEFQTIAGLNADFAAAVFQPYLVISSIMYGLLAFALGFKWVQRGERFGGIVGSIAEDSFGIYLSHVLFLMFYAERIQPHQSDFLSGLVILIIGLPLVYVTAFVFSEIARRTPLSILLTGRHRAKINARTAVNQ